MSGLAARFEVHPTVIPQWSGPYSAIGSRTMASAPLEGASGVLGKGAVNGVPRIDAETVRDLHAKIGVLAVADGLPSRRLGPWGGT